MLKEIIEEINGLNIKDLKKYNLTGHNPFYDYILLATGNKTNMQAVYNHVKDKFGIDHYEGLNSDWLLLKADNVIINILSQEARDEYKLEQIFKEFEEDI